MRILVAAGDDTLADYLRNAGHETKSLYINDLAARVAHEFKADAIVYQTTVTPTVLHEDAISTLKNAGFRVVLAADPNQQLIPYVAALGVTDILTFPIDPEDVLYRIENPATAADAADIVRKVKPENTMREHEAKTIKPGLSVWFKGLRIRLTENPESPISKQKDDFDAEILVIESYDNDNEESVKKAGQQNVFDRLAEKVSISTEQKKKKNSILGHFKAIGRDTDILQEKGHKQFNTAVVEETASIAEKYLHLVVDKMDKKQTSKVIKICVISPRATGVTFTSVNLAYCLSMKQKVAIIGEDCGLYLNNQKNIRIIDSVADINNEEIVIIDTHNIVDADLVILVYSPDLHYIDKVRELDLVLSTKKVRVLNKSTTLPISVSKLLGFEPEVVVPVINNSRQILLGRPAAMDCPDVMQACQKIAWAIEREIYDKNRMSKPAVLS